jgi:hypothetical protein
VSDQNIVEVKWYGKHGVTYRGNRKNKTITDNDGERVGKQRIDTTEEGCRVVGGVGVYHLVGDRRRGSEPHRVEGAGDGLWVPLHKPRYPGLRLRWWSSGKRHWRRERSERRPHLGTGES